MSKSNASRRRERKIIKLYRKLAIRRDERLVRRLRFLQQAEANEIQKRNQPPIDRAVLDATLRRADELLKRYESAEKNK